jgi:hypothetical protein
VRLEILGKLKKSNDLIGNGTRDFPACSRVPQPIALPRAQTNDDVAVFLTASCFRSSEPSPDHRNCLFLSISSPG